MKRPSILRPLDRWPLVAALLALAPLAMADLPAEPDSWTEFGSVAEAEATGWFITCGLSQQLCVEADCACGLTSVGCRNTHAYWNKRFGLATEAPLAYLTAVRFQHRTTWTTHDAMLWHLFLTMTTTAAEQAAGYDLKQVYWTYDKSETWTETTLPLADGTWQWRDADSQMWLNSAPGGTTETTTMASLEWHLVIPFGLATGEAKLIDDLTLITTGTAVGDVPAAGLIRAIYPNPANPRVSVKVDLPHDGPAVIEVLDTRGRRVATLHLGWLAAGDHTLTWHADDAAAGVYLVRLVAAGLEDQGRITVVR